MPWTEIGDGQEAFALKGEISECEGLGGIVAYCKPLVVTKRINWNKPINEHEGHDLFCKNLALKLLEKFFIREGKYKTEHIPVPIGSFNGGYYYLFVEGSEGFPLEIIDDDFRRVPVEIEGWDVFTGLFNSFGFSVERDIADALDGRTGKNIIFSEWDMKEVYRTGKLHKNWKRIDFGSVSCPFDYSKFQRTMLERGTELISKMKEDYSLAFLAAQYYLLNQKLPSVQLSELEKRALEFRSRLS